MEKEKNLLQICKYCSIIVVIGLIVCYSAWLQPIASLSLLFKSVWIVIIPCAGLLYLTFGLVEDYFRRLADYNSYLNVLDKFQMTVSPTMNIEDLCTRILDVLVKIFNAKQAVLVINEPEIKKLAKNSEFIIHSQTEKTNTKNGKRAIHHFRTFYPAAINNETKPCVDEILKKYAFEKYSTVAVVPFTNENRLIAIAMVGMHNPQKDFFEYIKKPVEIFSKNVSLIFEMMLLRQKLNLASITDSLTGLYNKRYFQQRINEEFSRAKRNDFPVAVIISDLDNFKYYVDRYGHPLTDGILCQIATFVRKLVRESDIICRFGGDEFIYMLPFATSSDAYRIAERLQSALISKGFPLDEANSIFITMSFGIASFPEHGDTWEKIVKNADRALFQSKEKGKNRITIYQAAL